MSFSNSWWINATPRRNSRHDAVAWGYARQADDMGVDIIQNCEVIGFDVQDGKVQGVKLPEGTLKLKKLVYV